MNKAKRQVALLGGQLLPVYIGIKEFPASHLHVISSKGLETRIAILRKVLAFKGITVEEHLCQPFDFDSIKRVCTAIIVKHKHEGIMFNLTGGTKPMGLAAQAAMQEHYIEGFYINQSESFSTLPGFIQFPLTATLTIDEFFSLTEHQPKSFKQLKDLAAEIKVSKSVEALVSKHPQLYLEATDILKRKYSQPVNITVKEKLKDGSLEVTGEKVTLASKKGDTLKLTTAAERFVFTNGLWWELTVARHIAAWPSIKELIVQCELPQRSNRKVNKNEIDILVNLGRQLIFIECKSGTVKSEDLDKMKVVKDLYGGVISKSVLVCRYTPPPMMLERCSDLGIEVFSIEAGQKLEDLVPLLEKVAKQVVI